MRRAAEYCNRSSIRLASPDFVKEAIFIRQTVAEEQASHEYRARNNDPMLFPICEDGE
jgi:hypothetical protein